MGTLFLVATPIGNIEDISIRAIRTLLSSTNILCEDTRHTSLLIDTIKKRYADIVSIPVNHSVKYIRYDDRTEIDTTPVILSLLADNQDVVLVSDAGTPMIADPGYRIITACISRNIPIVSIPGPSAFVAAASVSGLPVTHVLFIGYLPEKEAKRLKVLTAVKKSKSELIAPTVFCYCAPHKLIQTLKELNSIMGDIPIVVIRELTKIHEEIFRGTITSALSHFQFPQGEFVICF